MKLKWGSRFFAVLLKSIPMTSKVPFCKTRNCSMPDVPFINSFSLFYSTNETSIILWSPLADVSVKQNHTVVEETYYDIANPKWPPKS